MNNKKRLQDFINQNYETIYDIYVNSEGKDINLYLCPDYINFKDFDNFFDFDKKEKHELYINFQFFLDEIEKKLPSTLLNEKDNDDKYLRDIMIRYLEENY